MKTYFETLWKNPAACGKFFATLIGVALMVVTSGLLPDVQWVQWAVAILTALSTYAIRNEKVVNMND